MTIGEYLEYLLITGRVSNELIRSAMFEDRFNRLLKCNFEIGNGIELLNKQQISLFRYLDVLYVLIAKSIRQNRDKGYINDVIEDYNRFVRDIIRYLGYDNFNYVVFELLKHDLLNRYGDVGSHVILKLNRILSGGIYSLRIDNTIYDIAIRINSNGLMYFLINNKKYASVIITKKGVVWVECDSNTKKLDIFDNITKYIKKDPILILSNIGKQDRMETKIIQILTNKYGK